MPKTKKDIFIAIFVIFLISGAIAGFFGFLFWLFSGEPTSTQAGPSYSEISFLIKNGFLNSERPESGFSGLKPPDLIEQNLNSENENFEVLATKLNADNYQMAFKLENKTEQDKEFYLIPVSKEIQLQFEEIKGVINNKNAISINKQDASNEPLDKLYDVEKHKKELNHELAKAYDDIESDGYLAKPIKIILPAESTLLASSVWQIPRRPTSGNSGLKPVYFLVYGSAGGAKDDLVILNIHSSPQQGDNWEVSFTTRGIGDLKIIPNDQATVEDDEFVSLLCDSEEKTPQILQGDVIFYPNWECLGTGKVIHYTKKAGKHTLMFEFGEQISFAYNTSGGGLSVKGGLKVKSSSVPAAQWLTGRSYRKKITIDHTYVDANLTDFPAYIKVSADVQIGDGAQVDGDDIRFTSSDGITLLSYEEESWTGGAGADATANYWVKVPTVFGFANTDIYIYYGNSGAADGQDAVNVWDTNFKGVWHLAETATDEGTAASLYQDSTTNNNDGTQAGPDDIAGKVYNGQDFDGTNDDVNLAATSTIIGSSSSQPFTATAWAKADVDPSVRYGIVTAYDSGGDFGWDLRLDASTPAAGAVFSVGNWNNNTAVSATANFVETDWNHYVGIFDGTNVKVYVNGVLGGTTGTGAIDGAANTIRIGSDFDRAAGRFFDGRIDEVHISSGTRSAAWIKFEYYNVNENDNELSWVAQETTPAATTIFRVKVP